VPELLTRLAGSLGDRLRGELSPHVASAVVGAAPTDAPKALHRPDKERSRAPTPLSGGAPRHHCMA
ncbi:MAG TPA: hypothetical protein VER33_02920, partial [Polyangiaceae bacterium]|nr:hypothetical protein [Polyangiaceae bacterium]